MGTSEHLGLFLDETRDELRVLDLGLRDLERDREDPDAVATVVRVVHTLKGMDAVLAAVEASGGDAAVAGVPGQGSAITFRFPLAQPCGSS